MIIILKIINILLAILILYNFINVLVKQYYSLKRGFKAIFTYLSLKGIVLFLMDIASFLFKGYYFYFCQIIINLVYLIFFGFNRLRFSRRNVTLMAISSSFLLVVLYFFPKLLSFKILVIPLILIISYYLVLPMEICIRNYFIKLARNKLSQYPNVKIIGITGSFGKTSFRNYLVSVLKYKYQVSTPRNNTNTLMGITKYINQEFTQCDFLVFELGIDEKGQMEQFKRLFKLDYAIITSIGNMHLATFKNVKNVLTEKLKIQSLLKENGVLFLNQDNYYLKEVKGEHIIYYGKDNLSLKSFDINGITLLHQNKEYLFPVHQTFFASYFDGIMKICEMVDINPEYLYQLSSTFKDYQRRNQVFKIDHGYLIDNSYNANLNGIQSSLSLLDTLSGSKYIITGGLIEQGKNFINENRQLQELFQNRNIVFVGKNNHPLLKKHQFASLICVKNIKEAYKVVRDIDPDNILLLAKGEDIYLR